MISEDGRICVDCSEPFLLTEGWKKLLLEKPNEVKPPKRCRKCIYKRKLEKIEYLRKANAK